MDNFGFTTSFNYLDTARDDFRAPVAAAPYVLLAFGDPPADRWLMGRFIDLCDRHDLKWRDCGFTKEGFLINFLDGDDLTFFSAFFHGHIIRIKTEKDIGL